MALSHDFNQKVAERVEHDPAFAKGATRLPRI
jgi:hypothetical protein